MVRLQYRECRKFHLHFPDTKLIVDGKEFHQNCFKCSHCSSQLDSVYGRKEGQYYCETCYVQIAGKKCSDCGQVILGPGLKFGTETFHTACFKGRFHIKEKNLLE